MARSASTLDSLFDRSWRPGHPFRPRLSPLRRWGILLLLTMLLAIIAAYIYITDSDRVRRMCQSYLGHLTGGQVTVKHAALSIFEGLRLDGVSVRVDKSDAFDSTIFDAQTVQIKYDPDLIIRGQLEATEIVAIDARVRLVEDVTTRRWNFQRLPLPQQRPPQPGEAPQKFPPLPELNLRNAMIDYSQIQNGQVTSLGSMSLDGGLLPLASMGKYHFALQARGTRDGLGPSVTGNFTPSTGEVDARLENFEFGRDIKTMLPDPVQRYWEEHRLAGRLNIPSFHYQPNRNGEPVFRVETRLDDVVLSINPTEWLGNAESDRLATMRGAFDLLRAVGLNRDAPHGWPSRSRNATFGSTGFIDLLERSVAPIPVELAVSRGVFVFDQNGIELKQVNGQIEGNTFVLDGKIAGYSPTASAEISVVGSDVHIPNHPRYLNSLPREVRELYEHMHPAGKGSLWMKLVRPKSGGRPQFVGALDVSDASILLDQFPYPLRKINGQISFGPDPVNETRLDIDLSASGALGGPNAEKSLFITGIISPVSPDGQMLIHAGAKDISSEKLVRDSLPADAREALDHLDPSHKGDFPIFGGDLAVDLKRVAGSDMPLNVYVTLDLRNAKGAYDAFPYPLEDVTGRLTVGPGMVKIINARGRHGSATVGIDGQFAFGRNKPLVPTVHLTGNGMPIDQDLLTAMQPDQRQWVEKLGIGGKVNIVGEVSRNVPATQSANPGGVSQPVPDIDVTLDIELRDGTLHPQGTSFNLSNLNGKLHSGAHQLVLTDFSAQRDAATIAGGGVIHLNGPEPELSLHADAVNLNLDRGLYSLLPSEGQSAWDAVDPHGSADVSFRYRSRPSTRPAAMQSARPSSWPGSMPASIEGLIDPGYELTLQPRDLSATFNGVPYRLEHVTGTVFVKNDAVTLKGLQARHGNGEIALSGTGTNNGRARWQLNLSGRNLPADNDLRRALPPAVVHILDSTGTTGAFSFDFPKLNYTGAPRADADASFATSSTATTLRQASSKPVVDGDLDITGKLWLLNAALDVGVPLADVQALGDFNLQVHNGRLAGFTGAVDASSLQIAGRPAANFHADLFKPADTDAMRIEKMRCSLAGGEMAGQVDVSFPQVGASRFGLTMVLRAADVRVLAGEKENIKGQLSASLSLEGAWGEMATRRGRGDVTVSGRDMYRIPLVLGLLQVTNLALPISSPFNDATVRYSVDGQKVTFENIEMRASNMVMQGNGSLDFGNKQVRMTFTTDNPNWPKLPLINDLIQGAKHELLQIQVSGTVQEPKVKGTVLNTLSTTIDQVFRTGNGQNKLPL